jgi:hypothetical protein
MPLKRTLRTLGHTKSDRGGDASPSAQPCGFIRHGESPVAARRKVARATFHRDRIALSEKGATLPHPQTRPDEFSQTLGKQIFLKVRFKLSENLQLILLDYAQKRLDAANITFKAIC